MLCRARTLTLSWLAALASCAGVAPDPSRVDAGELREVELTDEQRAQCERDEEAAIAAVLRRNYVEAGEAAVRVLSVDPRAARCRAVLGMVRLQLAGREDPIEWAGLRAGEAQMELARQLAPDDAFVGWMRAVFLAEAGHMSAAAAVAEEALVRAEAAPDDERAALLGIAGTYRYELGEERAALPHLRGYLTMRPDDTTARFRLGICLLRISQVPKGLPDVKLQQAQAQAESAAIAFLRCAEQAPGDEDAALSVSSAYLRAAELADERGDAAGRDARRGQAVAHLRKVAERFAQSPEAHFRLGVIATMQEQPEEARAAYVVALERDPRHLPSMLNLAALLVGGDDDAARGLLQRALASDELSRDERRRIEQWLEGAPAPREG